jgi:hypothetical protein
MKLFTSSTRIPSASTSRPRIRAAPSIQTPPVRVPSTSAPSTLTLPVSTPPTSTPSLPPPAQPSTPLPAPAPTPTPSSIPTRLPNHHFHFLRPSSGRRPPPRRHDRAHRTLPRQRPRLARSAKGGICCVARVVQGMLRHWVDGDGANKQ